MSGSAVGRPSTVLRRIGGIGAVNLDVVLFRRRSSRKTAELLLHMSSSRVNDAPSKMAKKKVKSVSIAGGIVRNIQRTML